MAGTPTPVYGWPLPALTDPPDGPAQMAALGNAIDSTVAAMHGRLPYAMAAGKVTTTTATGNNAIQVTVNFPAGRFSVAPIVTLAVAQIPATSAEQRTHEPFLYALSATSMSVQQNNLTGTNWTSQFDIHWMAVQMLAGAAPGVLAADVKAAGLATCHTAECDNAGIPIPVALLDGEMFCGVCGHPVTDVERD